MMSHDVFKAQSVSAISKSCHVSQEVLVDLCFFSRDDLDRPDIY